MELQKMDLAEVRNLVKWLDEQQRKSRQEAAVLHDAEPSVQVSASVQGAPSSHVYEEFVVVDGAGRLQIPPDLRAEFGMCTCIHKPLEFAQLARLDVARGYYEL